MKRFLPKKLPSAFSNGYFKIGVDHYFKQSNVELANVVNEYTHLDPTLPRIKSMKCPNVECETNIQLDKPCTILYIRYDDTNLKFVYMCSTCKYTWNTEQFSAASS